MILVTLSQFRGSADLTNRVELCNSIMIVEIQFLFQLYKIEQLIKRPIKYKSTTVEIKFT